MYLRNKCVPEVDIDTKNYTEIKPVKREDQNVVSVLERGLLI